METDKIGRRNRYRRQPIGENVYLRPRDIEWLAFIHRHGGRLPTSYIHNYSSSHLKSRQTTSRRLSLLYNELGLLTREPAQKETLDPRANEVVHTIDEKGIELLKEEGLYFEHAPAIHGAFKHQVFQGCVSASLELNAKEHGFEFVPQHELGPTTMDVGQDRVTPDYVCMLKKDGKDLLVFVEVDRGTEATVSNNFNRKSWKRSIGQYRQIIGKELYKQHFGVSCGALLLVLTVSPDKQMGILDVIKKDMGKCNYILVSYIPEFGREFKPPKELSLLHRTWYRAAPSNFSFVV